MRNLIVAVVSALALCACATNTAGHRPPAVAAIVQSAQGQPANLPLGYDSGPQVKPRYPGFDGMYGIQGTVVLLVLVMPSGQVVDIKVEKSAGHRELDRAAIDAARQWHFIPERKNGMAVAGYARIPVIFSTPDWKVPGDWPANYAHPRYLLDNSAMPYASVDDAFVGVLKAAHGAMADNVNGEIQTFVVRDGSGVIRERWSFTDMDTENAMALHYVFTGTGKAPVVRVAALCRRGIAICAGKVAWLLKGPTFARTIAAGAARDAVRQAVPGR